MAKKIEQNIKGDDNIQQTVGMQIIISGEGVSEERVREISSVMARKIADEYFQLSQDLANKRIENFQNIFVERLNGIENGLSAFKDPDFVLAYRKSQIQAATTDEESNYKMLTELLFHRQSQANDGYKKTGIDGAIELVNKLSDSTLSGLTILTCINMAILPLTNQLDEGLETLNNCYESILKYGLPNNSEWLDQLDILKAIRLNNFSTFKKFEEIIAQQMDGYSSAGIKKDSEEYKYALEIQNRVHINALCEHPLNSGYYIIPVFAKNGIDKMHKNTTFGISVPLNVDEVSALKEILNLYTKNDAEINEANNRFIKKIDSYSSLKMIHEWWNTIPHSCELTIVGRVLGHANAKKCYKGFPDLD